jgi:hypothetical protein
VYKVQRVGGPEWTGGELGLVRPAGGYQPPPSSSHSQGGEGGRQGCTALHHHYLAPTLAIQTPCRCFFYSVSPAYNKAMIWNGQVNISLSKG